MKVVSKKIDKFGAQTAGHAGKIWVCVVLGSHGIECLDEVTVWHDGR